MKIEFVKNLQFTKLVKADGRLREFNFRRMNGPDGSSFTVDVVDDRGQRKIFKMEKKENAWKISTNETLPVWIMDNEKVLEKSIEEELQNS